MAGKSEEPLYIGVQQPKEVRRKLLESLKEIVGFLKRFEEFKATRARKIALFLEFHQVTSDIKKDLALIRTKLPVTHSVPSSSVPTQSKKAQKTAPSGGTAPALELDRLKKELARIEGQLSRMG